MFAAASLRVCQFINRGFYFKGVVIDSPVIVHVLMAFINFVLFFWSILTFLIWSIAFFFNLYFYILVTIRDHTDATPNNHAIFGCLACMCSW